MNGAVLGLVMNAPEIWNPIIEKAYGGLFDIDYLTSMGMVYAREFAGETLKDGEGIPSIPLAACRFEQAELFCAEKSGFDLPTLITPKSSWNGKIVAFAAQDPLRTGDWCADALTMSTPWGFNYAPNWSVHGNMKIWHSVTWLCAQGYGAYFTDISKLYLATNAGRISKATKKAEADVFQLEWGAVDPALWVAFGNRAQSALRKVAPATEHAKIDCHPHPKAYGALKRGYQTENESHAVIQEAIRLQIARKLGLI